MIMMIGSMAMVIEAFFVDVLASQPFRAIFLRKAATWTGTQSYDRIFTTAGACHLNLQFMERQALSSDVASTTVREPLDLF